MSETISPPRPGSVEAFKQRREAYAIAATIKDDVYDATSRLQIGMAKEAHNDLKWLVSQIEKNPEAQRVVAMRAPGYLGEAKQLLEEARKEAPGQVREVGRGSWHTSDGHTETRLSFGKSDHGHHYRLETATPSHESGGNWSRSFKTAEIARSAGQSAQVKAQRESTPDFMVTSTPRAAHADKLQTAAHYRRIAGESSQSSDTKAEIINVAKSLIRQASTIRQASGHQQTQERHAPRMAMAR